MLTLLICPSGVLCISNQIHKLILSLKNDSTYQLKCQINDNIHFQCFHQESIFNNLENNTKNSLSWMHTVYRFYCYPVSCLPPAPLSGIPANTISVSQLVDIIQASQLITKAD